MGCLVVTFDSIFLSSSATVNLPAAFTISKIVCACLGSSPSFAAFLYATMALVLARGTRVFPLLAEAVDLAAFLVADLFAEAMFMNSLSLRILFRYSFALLDIITLFTSGRASIP